MPQWFCTICYHEFQEGAPPAACPACGAQQKSLLTMAAGGATKPIPQNLEEVRDRAREKLKGICAAYPACDGGPDKICQREAYGRPIGLGGVGSGASFRANVTALAALCLRTRLVGDHFTPNTGFSFFGTKLVMPILGASASGIGRYNESITELDFCLFIRCSLLDVRCSSLKKHQRRT